jgi:hypothetical protein
MAIAQHGDHEKFDRLSFSNYYVFYVVDDGGHKLVNACHALLSASFYA